MLRASTLALLLWTTMPAHAAPPSPFWFEQMAAEQGTPDIHGSVPDWRLNCGEPGEYTDSRCDPASPDFVSTREFDEDYDPEGEDKYLYSGYPSPGDPGYDEYVTWYLDGMDQTGRPDGMTDGEYVEWLEAGCGDEPVCG
jgi:hypothetical protein